MIRLLSPLFRLTLLTARLALGFSMGVAFCAETKEPAPKAEHAPKVIAEAPKAVAEGPKAIAEGPKAIVEVPKAIAEAPKVVAEEPKTLAEAPKAITEAPKAVVEAPKVIVEAPKAVTEAPKVVAEEPKTVAEAPKAVAEAPKAVVEAPKAIVEAPNAMVEVPKAVAEAPKAVAEVPKAAVEVPKAIVEVPKVIAHAPKAVAELPLSKEVTVVEPAPTPVGKSANAKTVHAIGEAAIAKASAKASAPLPQAITDEFMGLLTLGINLTDRADYNSAEIAFHQILKAPGVPLPTTKGALLGLARMHRKQGELTKAVAIYEKFLKEYPTDDRVPDALLDLGRTLRAMGAYRGAIARFYSVINSTLKLPEEGFERYQLLAKTAQFEIAETHYETGDYAEASKFFLRLRQLDLAPADRARAHFKAAYAFHLSGNHETSVTTLHAYLDQCPDDENVPEARYLLAINLRKLKRSQEALAATLELLSTEKSKMNADPKRWTYWQRRTGNQLANDFFENGDTVNAQIIYTSLLSLSNEPGWILSITYQIALCYERLGATELAGKSYQRIIESAGPTPSPDLAELTQMATWRLDHLGWRENTQRQLTNFFETTTGKSPVPPPAPKATSTQP